MPKTLFDKIWASHKIKALQSGHDLIAIDRTFLHERTGSIALQSLQNAGHHVRRPSHVFCTMDHIVSNALERTQNAARMPGGEAFITQTRQAAMAAGIHLIDVLNPDQGIVHVIAPEQGVAVPGISIICPDSHTCTLGALGALAWGVGSSDSEHAMATGTMRVKKPPQMRIKITGELHAGVSAKDVALHIIRVLGAGGGQRCAIEYCGTVVDNMSIEERLTLCNLAVEFAAFTAIIAPDTHTYNYVKNRRYAPSRLNWAQANKYWKTLKSDADAHFDHAYEFDGADILPTVTWGTNPEQAAPAIGAVPYLADLLQASQKDAAERALYYMGISEGQVLSDLSIGGAFIGSCTNGRLSDLRAAADILKGRHVASGVKAICVPGSQSVRREAEAEGIDLIFKHAGFEWGAPGCAFCFYAGGDTFAPQTRVISSTNRNFEGRQGPHIRTHLASPALVAASAVAGHIATPHMLKTIS